MPRIYRAMLRDGNEPKVGPSKKMLGAKAGADKHDDIAPDADGNVSSGKGGMSVAPAWRDLPAYRIPRRLRDRCPKATGSNEYACWQMGEGPFENGRVAEKLILAVDQPAHGTVQPERVMTLDEYQSALAATQHQWVIDED